MKRSKPLSLHVPEPSTRPGDKPDFSHISISQAGNANKPSIDVCASSIRQLAFDLVRVLDDDANAVGDWQPNLSKQELTKGLTAMVKTRIFDERLQMAQRQGKTSIYVQCRGEEAIACAQKLALSKHDMFFPTYRQQGLLIADDFPVVDMINQIYSNSKDKLGGRSLPFFYSEKDHGFFSISGNLGTQFSQAVGWAMASAIKGDNRIASAFIGDGSTAESDFHAALVFASVYKPPVLLNVVNNQWAISSYQGIAGGEAANFACRGHGFNIPSFRVDGNDYLAVYAVSKWAEQRARNNLGPTLIEWVTYRAAAHSTSDDPSRYRPIDDYQSWPLGDPIERLKAHMIKLGIWSEQQHQQLEQQLTQEIKAAAKQAEANGTLKSGPHPAAEELFEHVFKELPEHILKQRQQMQEQQ
ncbi:thiamine pyrophosphate-dependent enzyme [Paraferrimonas sp. SM1919]|uniref:thiamine pyrophosphate-dependent enzyme n=1 Tax=Paraferrimonas sp. SM1919 TaxID=2662263 RepID=UPI0013D4E6E6|nr:thiamine pyrophosphate-dependent enzyme [Paraferrimonas sp. SM1919]